MKIIKKYAIVTLSFALFLIMFPLATYATGTSDSVSNSLSLEESYEMYLCEEETLIHENEVVEVDAVNHIVHPVCNHSDPTRPTAHSTMRYIRTVNYFNYIDMKYDIRDWYQCINCGYEDFFVHGQF